MKKILLCFFLLIVGLAACGNAGLPRQRIPADDGWKFLLGDSPEFASPTLNDSGWRAVTLPHDWSIEGKIDPKAPMGGGGGFFPSGTGWYRHAFRAREEWNGKRVAVEFEGVYMNAEIYLNGQKLDQHPYGYTSFFVDLTPALKTEGDNLLAVRVDNSIQKNSRWYAGSGIYRHVWLHVMPRIHVADWGIFVSTTRVDGTAATVTVKTDLLNETSQAQNAKLQTTIVGPDGQQIGQANATCALPAQGSQETENRITIQNPPLWSPESPRISKAITKVFIDDRLVDQIVTPFGIRELRWTAAAGLTINGKPTKLKGGCIHADNGVLGVAAFDRAEERKIELLKAAGFNAVRTSHHPPSPALLDICDRLGMLVMDEAFDCWTAGKNKKDYQLYFKDWWQRDLRSMILRDRNHPSIVMWSIGNEIPAIYDRADVAEYGPKLVEEIHALDKTRPVTNAILGWPIKPNAPAPTDEERLKNARLSWDCQDIVGTNYALNSHIKQQGEYPDRILVSTESYPPLGEPRLSQENPFVIGDFVWSAQDYLGEAGIGRWFYENDPTEPMRKGDPDKPPTPVGHGEDVLYPWHGAHSGLLDILGDPKPALTYWNVAWQTGPKIGIGVRQPQSDRKVIHVGWGWYPTWASWTWPGWEGKPVEVEVYSASAKTRLYLNDILLGEESVKNNRAIHTVPYQPGILRAVGVDNGIEVNEAHLVTAGDPVAIRLTVDRTRLKANQQDLSFVKVEAIDKDGNVQPNANHRIRFIITGPGSIAGLGNANLKSEEPYQGTECSLFHGKALVVLRTATKAGKLQLKAEAEGLPPTTIAVQTE